MYIDLQNAINVVTTAFSVSGQKCFFVLEAFYFPTGWLRLTLLLQKNYVAIQWSNGKVEWFTMLNLPAVGSKHNPWWSKESLNPVPSHLLQLTFSGVPKWWLKQSELQACTCAFNLSKLYIFLRDPGHSTASAMQNLPDFACNKGGLRVQDASIHVCSCNII